MTPAGQGGNQTPRNRQSDQKESQRSEPPARLRTPSPEERRKQHETVQQSVEGEDKKPRNKGGHQPQPQQGQDVDRQGVPAAK